MSLGQVFCGIMGVGLMRIKGRVFELLAMRWWMSIRMGPERDLLVAEGLDPVVYARRVAEARVNRVDAYDRK